MKDDENYGDFVSRTRGIALIWVIAFPLAIVLYGNFPNASITVLAMAVVATVLAIIVFSGQPEHKKSANRHSKNRIAPKRNVRHSISSSVFHKVRSFHLEFHDNVDGPIFCWRWKFIRNGRSSGTWEKYAPGR